MKIKVSRTTTTQLDWLVAKAEGKNGILHDDGIIRCIVIAAASGVYKGTFKPTTNWAQGGPIIEREGLELSVHVIHNGTITSWASEKDWPSTKEKSAIGPTPLIAAMRCYVASKLGDEAEIPEELA